MQRVAAEESTGKTAPRGQQTSFIDEAAIDRRDVCKFDNAQFRQLKNETDRASKETTKTDHHLSHAGQGLSSFPPGSSWDWDAVWCGSSSGADALMGLLLRTRTPGGALVVRCGADVDDFVSGSLELLLDGALQG